jgi:hypothetical protein
MKIARDKSSLKDGPGNYYDTIVILKAGTVVEYIENQKRTPAGFRSLTVIRKALFLNLHLRK